MDLSQKIDSIIGTNYDYKKANCWDLVMFLNDKAPKLDEVNEGIFSTARKFKEYKIKYAADFKSVVFPKDGDIILMGSSNDYMHAGIFYNDGVVHAADVGVIWQPLSTIKVLYKNQKAYRWQH